MDGAIQTTNRFNNGLKHKPWVLGLRIEEFSILIHVMVTTVHHQNVVSKKTAGYNDVSTIIC